MQPNLSYLRSSALKLLFLNEGTVFSIYGYFYAFVQDCSISIVNTLETPVFLKAIN